LKKTPQKHSTRVGGSTAARVLACPGSVRLCAEVPPDKGSEYALEGTLLHIAAAAVLERNISPMKLAGLEHEGMVLTEELIEEKLIPAIKMFDDILDELESKFGKTAVFEVEKEVSFGDVILDAFGSCDVLVRVGPRAVVIDWKFGDGNLVDAEDNKQMLFYGAAAARTSGVQHIFKGATELELVIIQPRQGQPSRWSPDIAALGIFETELISALRYADRHDAYFFQGDHCKWCKGKAGCPLMHQAMERAFSIDWLNMDPYKLGKAVKSTYLLEDFIDKIRSTVHQALENGIEVPGCKLVAKRPSRKYIDEAKAEKAIRKVLTGLENPPEHYMMKTELKSPAQMEKAFKELAKTLEKDFELPEGIIESVSSGTTLALEDDPRPSVNMQAQLATSLKKIAKQ
jgi:hypothetical protein